MEEVTVRIQKGSLKAKEENTATNPSMGVRHTNYESMLRTFDIDYSDVPVTSKKLILNGYLENSVLQAEILPNGKIRII